MLKVLILPIVFYMLYRFFFSLKGANTSGIGHMHTDLISFLYFFFLVKQRHHATFMSDVPLWKLVFVLFLNK